MSSWQIVLLEPARVVLGQIGQFMVSVLLVVIVLIIGWIISGAVKAIVTKGLRMAKLDELSVRIELDNLLAKGGIKYSLSELIGVICYWLGILITFMVALTFVNIATSNILDKIVSYIPSIISAIFILILGMFFATLLRNLVLATASNAGIGYASFLAKVTEVIVRLFTVLMALEQLRIGVRISEIIVSIVLGSVGLGCALAFGLGCRDMAAKFMGELSEKMKLKK